jgi:hypothetical protein
VEIEHINGLDECEDGSHAWEPKGACNDLYPTGQASYGENGVYKCAKCGLIMIYHYSVGRSGEPEFTVRFDRA